MIDGGGSISDERGGDTYAEEDGFRGGKLFQIDFSVCCRDESTEQSLTVCTRMDIFNN